MRRKHQQTFGKREYIESIPNSHQRTGKIYCKKVSEEKNSMMQDLEVIKQSLEAAESDKRVEVIGSVIKGLLPAALLFALGVFILFFFREPADKKENVVLRHYSEVLRKVDEEPEDIASAPYESNVPSVIQKDIDKMLEMGEDAMVVYYNDVKDQIIIEPSEASENGYRIRFKDENNLYSVIEVEEVKSNISFYKNGDTLVIYGGSQNIRNVSRYSMNNEGVDYDYLENGYVDLYGVNPEYDEIRFFNSYATLIKNGNEFSLYHLGEKIYTTKFEGGEIVDWSYYYITTAQKSCYNLYYSVDPQDSWIKFCKVAENVDEVLDNEKVNVPYEKGGSMEFPIFKIGNKKYAQIPDPAAERTYGQNYGGNNVNDENLEVDFTSRLVEVSALSSSKVELKYEYDSWKADSYVWRIYYYFQVDDRECYIAKRINGLDSTVSKVIPQEKLDIFNEKVILPDEIEEYINQLKLLYDEYTDNTF